VVEKWVYLSSKKPFGEYECAWVLPIIHAVKVMQSAKHIKADQEFWNLAKAISVRLYILKRAHDRMESSKKDLMQTIKYITEEYISTKDSQKHPYPVDNDMYYNILGDINTFLFECKACWELIFKWYFNIYELLATGSLSNKKLAKKLRKDFEEAGIDFKLQDKLSEERSYFIHNGSPSIVLDFSTLDRGTLDILIAKNDLQNFQNKKQHTPYTELTKIYRDFLVIMQQSANFIEKQIEKFSTSS